MGPPPRRPPQPMELSAMFKLPPLPYAYDALQPTMSADTLRTHHDKHHAKYVETVNELLKSAPAKPLEDVVRSAAREAAQKKLFNNAAQAWNHAFFWDCMAPQAGAPQGALAKAIERDLGGLEALKKAFTTEGGAHFGSGWVWLAARGDALEILTTHDGENLLTRPELTPLLVCDLWEHAYYLDYKNDRPGFLGAWFDKLANWDFAAAQHAAGAGAGALWRYPEPAAAKAA